MELKKPKPKKHTLSRKSYNLPLKREKQLVGVFNGQSVVISDWDSMNLVYSGGNFGKGTLSKSAPIYHIKNDEIPKVILEQQFKNISKWNANIHYSSSKKYSGSMKNDWELSCLSIDKFIKSTFEDMPQNSWKIWKENHKKYSTKHLKNCDEIKNIQSLLEFHSDENYTDLAFCNKVNKILQLQQGKKLTIAKTKLEEEVIVIDSFFDTSTNDVLIADLNPRLKRIPYIAEENLNLSLEESFFLKFAAGCLNILDNNFSELGTAELWEKFNYAQKNFFNRYVIYHYYKTKGWVVKSGIKFGGDYLLYKDGPAYNHASYLVQILDKSKKMSWKEFIAINRLVETFNKTLILCNVLPTEPLSIQSFPNGFQNYSVREVLTRRWFPSKERFSKDENA